jgi:DNA invertase Pin-like site-specific DNA recombinase
MIYGYARVSTKGQAKDGNGLDVQEKQLRENGATEIYFESFTGTKKHRPELDKLMAILQEGDTLVVTKLDRIARSAVHGISIIEELLNKGVIINILNMGKFDSSPAGKLMRTIFFAFAEFERDMIVERTSEGKEVCRENNPEWREGRKTVDIPDFEKFLKKQKDGEMSVSECCKHLKISRSTWYNRVAEVSA